MADETRKSLLSKVKASATKAKEWFNLEGESPYMLLATTVKNEKRLGFKEGFTDALNRRVVTRDWKIWKPEVAWLTGYFSLAVWVSMGLMVLPGYLIQILAGNLIYILLWSF